VHSSPLMLRHAVPKIAAEPDPRAGSCRIKAGGVVPAGLFCWFAWRLRDLCI